MADDDKAEELECGKKKKLGKKSDGQGTGNTHAAARTAATRDSEENATRDAMDEAAKFKCPAECPAMRIDLKLSKPVITDIILDDLDDMAYSATASCEWTCKISCWDRGIPGGDKPAEPQDLYCDDEAVTAARGTATGKGDGPVLGNPPPPNAVALAEEAAKAAAITSLALDLGMTIRLAMVDIRCPDRCPFKTVRIWVGPMSKPQLTPPDANDVVHCTLTRRFQIRAACMDE